MEGSFFINYIIHYFYEDDKVSFNVELLMRLDLWIARQNVIRLEEKGKKEKETLEQIIKEAEEYKVEFYRKISIAVENKKASNKDKEKVIHQSKFLTPLNVLYVLPINFTL